MSHTDRAQDAGILADAHEKPSLLVPIVRATPESVAGYGSLVSDFHAEDITRVTWPKLDGWRPIVSGTGNKQVGYILAVLDTELTLFVEYIHVLLFQLIFIIPDFALLMLRQFLQFATSSNCKLFFLNFCQLSCLSWIKHNPATTMSYCFLLNFLGLLDGLFFCYAAETNLVLPDLLPLYRVTQKCKLLLVYKVCQKSF